MANFGLQVCEITYTKADVTHKITTVQQSARNLNIIQHKINLNCVINKVNSDLKQIYHSAPKRVILNG